LTGDGRGSDKLISRVLIKIPVRDYLGPVLPGLADFPIRRIAELTLMAWATRNDQPNPATPPTVCLLAGYTPARFPDQSLALPPIRPPPGSKTSSPVSPAFGLASVPGARLTATKRHPGLRLLLPSRLARRCRCSVLGARRRLRQNAVELDPLPSNSSTSRSTSSPLRRFRWRPASFCSFIGPLDQKMGQAARWGWRNAYK
jgi:hypothetical protein